MIQVETSQEPILPINIVALDGGQKQQSDRSQSPEKLLDLRHWQIEEFLRQTGKADNTQRSYKRQLKKFSSWCNKSWLDVIPSDIGKYRRELKQQELKPASINHALNTLRAFYQWLGSSRDSCKKVPLTLADINLGSFE